MQSPHPQGPVWTLVEMEHARWTFASLRFDFPLKSNGSDGGDALLRGLGVRMSSTPIRS